MYDTSFGGFFGSNNSKCFCENIEKYRREIFLFLKLKEAHILALWVSIYKTPAHFVQKKIY